MFLYFRQFIQSNYQTIKQSNPDLPVLVREATGAPARAFARFGQLFFFHFLCTSINQTMRLEYGVEKNVSLDGLSSGEVTKEIENLLNRTNQIKLNIIYTLKTHNHVIKLFIDIFLIQVI